MKIKKVLKVDFFLKETTVQTHNVKFFLFCFRDNMQIKFFKEPQDEEIISFRSIS